MTYMKIKLDESNIEKILTLVLMIFEGKNYDIDIIKSLVDVSIFKFQNLKMDFLMLMRWII